MRVELEGHHAGRRVFIDSERRERKIQDLALPLGRRLVQPALVLLGCAAVPVDAHEVVRRTKRRDLLRNTPCGWIQT